MDRDIIIIWSNYDITYVTLNGFEIKYGMERGYETRPRAGGHAFRSRGTAGCSFR